MNDVERRAMAMVDRISGPLGCSNWSDATRADIILALIEAIQAGDAERAAHDAFRLEVSEAVEKHIRMTNDDCSELWCGVTRDNLSRFIIQPKTDPLVEAVCAAISDSGSGDFVAQETLRAALAKRGLEIREVGE